MATWAFMQQTARYETHQRFKTMIGAQFSLTALLLQMASKPLLLTETMLRNCA